MKRRNFLKISALASSALFIPGFVCKIGESENAKKLYTDGKKLVIIQLSGGNDGLNTCIPFQNDIYYKLRPSLHVKANEVLAVGSEMGFNPALAALQGLYDQGDIGILNSVGYPNPDRSHFRSMDIWHTGSASNEYWDTGWLGRYLDASCSGCVNPHTVLEIGEGLSLAVKGKENKGLAAKDIAQLKRSTTNPYLHTLTEAHKQAAESASSINDLDYLYKTMVETEASAEYLFKQSKIYKSKQTYPVNKLSKSLKTIAELICSGCDTSVYYASLPGFDTHVRQKGQQDRLLKMYADSVAAFVKDLKQNNQWDNTLVMTFSEFGRRVKQNASGGTDHGTANSLFLMGGKLKKAGFINAAPNLSDLSKGDLKHQVDFRQVYATILEDWLGAKSESILQSRFDKLGFI